MPRQSQASKKMAGLGRRACRTGSGRGEVFGGRTTCESCKSVKEQTTSRNKPPARGGRPDQLRRVIVKYLRDHPEDRFDSADILVGLALTESFPCKEKAGRAKKPDRANGAPACSRDLARNLNCADGTNLRKRGAFLFAGAPSALSGDAPASGASRARGSKRANCLLRFYGWFTEGFDTRDLKEAKELLEELAR